jgi:hypothetical protein
MIDPERFLPDLGESLTTRMVRLQRISLVRVGVASLSPKTVLSNGLSESGRKCGICRVARCSPAERVLKIYRTYYSWVFRPQRTGRTKLNAFLERKAPVSGSEALRALIFPSSEWEP